MNPFRSMHIKIHKKWKCQILSQSKLITFFNMLPFSYIIFIEAWQKLWAKTAEDEKFVCPSLFQKILETKKHRL